MLYLVATPIGNRDDITLRALATLKMVDVVASEDTRRTGMLLKHYGIKKPLMSFYEHNEERAGGIILSLLKEGKSVAVVTDAGTPGVSDPGFTLVRRALEESLPLTLIPGPNAAIMALVLSGLPMHSFTFRGFPPRKAGPRLRFLLVDQHSPHTLVYYESPYRLKRFLDDALTAFGNRRAAIANDLTKLYESVQRGTLAELREVTITSAPRGEYTVVISGAGDDVQPEAFYAGEEEDDQESR